MKFDVVIQNPPYNPNSLWKKFVEKGIDLLNDNGQMLAIHPVSWREVSTFKNLFNNLKEHISELHINEYEIWKEQKVAIKTDWYLYNKQKINETKIFYSNGNIDKLCLKQFDKILRFSTKSIPYSILSKITNDTHNNIIFEKGFNKLYNKPSLNGKYKQCGGIKNGTGWTNNDYFLTDSPSESQFQNKVVMSYAGKPRAKYFSSEDEIGVVLGYYWLTDNKSLPILLNSKLLWKLVLSILDPEIGMYKPYGTPSQIPAFLLKSLNFDNLNVQTEEELYIHYNLTQEEINLIEQ